MRNTKSFRFMALMELIGKSNFASYRPGALGHSKMTREKDYLTFWLYVDRSLFEVLLNLGLHKHNISSEATIPSYKYFHIYFQILHVH